MHYLNLINLYKKQKLAVNSYTSIILDANIFHIIIVFQTSEVSVFFHHFLIIGPI